MPVKLSVYFAQIPQVWFFAYINTVCWHENKTVISKLLKVLKWIQTYLYLLAYTYYIINMWNHCTTQNRKKTQHNLRNMSDKDIGGRWFCDKYMRKIAKALCMLFYVFYTIIPPQTLG